MLYQLVSIQNVFPRNIFLSVIFNNFEDIGNEGKLNTNITSPFILSAKQICHLSCLDDVGGLYKTEFYLVFVSPASCKVHLLGLDGMIVFKKFTYAEGTSISAMK